MKHFLVLRYRSEISSMGPPDPEPSVFQRYTISYLKSLCTLVSKGLLRPCVKKACCLKQDQGLKAVAAHLYFGFSWVPPPPPPYSRRIYATETSFRMKRALSMLNPGEKQSFDLFKISPYRFTVGPGSSRLLIFCKIQLVVYYRCCVLIG